MADRDVGIGGEVEDRVEAVFGEQRVERGGVGRVTFHEGEGGIALQRRQVRAPPEQQIVERDHPLAAGDQHFAQMASDEAGAAGDEDGHAAAFPSRAAAISCAMMCISA